MSAGCPLCDGVQEMDGECDVCGQLVCDMCLHSCDVCGVSTCLGCALNSGEWTTECQNAACFAQCRPENPACPCDVQACCVCNKACWCCLECADVDGASCGGCGKFVCSDCERSCDSCVSPNHVGLPTRFCDDCVRKCGACKEVKCGFHSFKKCRMCGDLVCLHCVKNSPIQSVCPDRVPGKPCGVTFISKYMCRTTYGPPGPVLPQRCSAQMRTLLL